MNSSLNGNQKEYISNGNSEMSLTFKNSEQLVPHKLSFSGPEFGSHDVALFQKYGEQWLKQRIGIKMTDKGLEDTVIELPQDPIGSPDDP